MKFKGVERMKRQSPLLIWWQTAHCQKCFFHEPGYSEKTAWIGNGFYALCPTLCKKRSFNKRAALLLLLLLMLLVLLLITSLFYNKQNFSLGQCRELQHKLLITLLYLYMKWESRFGLVWFIQFCLKYVLAHGRTLPDFPKRQFGSF